VLVFFFLLQWFNDLFYCLFLFNRRRILLAFVLCCFPIIYSLSDVAERVLEWYEKITTAIEACREKKKLAANSRPPTPITNNATSASNTAAPTPDHQNPPHPEKPQQQPATALAPSADHSHHSAPPSASTSGQPPSPSSSQYPPPSHPSSEPYPMQGGQGGYPQVRLGFGHCFLFLFLLFRCICNFSVFLLSFCCWFLV
jgi:hypothetical protein